MAGDPSQALGGQTHTTKQQRQIYIGLMFLDRRAQCLRWTLLLFGAKAVVSDVRVRVGRSLQAALQLSGQVLTLHICDITRCST